MAFHYILTKYSDPGSTNCVGLTGDKDDPGLSSLMFLDLLGCSSTSLIMAGSKVVRL